MFKKTFAQTNQRAHAQRRYVPATRYGRETLGFRTAGLRDMRGGRGVRSVHTGLSPVLLHAATHSKEAAFIMLGGSPRGLAPDVVKAARDLYGANVFETSASVSPFKRLARSFASPFTLVLLVLVGISLTTDVVLAAPGSQDPSSAIIIAVMVIVSGLLAFVQESSGADAADSLKKMVSNTCCVVRRGANGRSEDRELAMADVVPGDMLRLIAGDMIPADARIVEAKDLFINQAALTGESEPVEKTERVVAGDEGAPVDPNALALSDCCNIAFAGTSVQSGTGMALVVATGRQTYLGSVACALGRQKAVPSAFDAGIAAVSRVLMGFMLVMCPVVLVICGVTKGNWVDALLFAVSIAVGITPQMLPVIVTTCLSRGAAVLHGEDVIVKELGAVQNLGAMNVLCCDKTGTLTQDKVVLERHLDVLGSEDVRVLRMGYLNSRFQTGVGNLIDHAVVEKLGELEDAAAIDAMWHKVDELPFDFDRRRMSVVVEDALGERLMTTKGAVEEVLACCAFAEVDGRVVELDETLAREVVERTQALNEAGLRVVAVACKRVDATGGDVVLVSDTAPVMPEARAASSGSAFTMPMASVISTSATLAAALSKDDETDMTLIGYLAFLDPPKPTAAAAIEELGHAGVDVKVLTGDSERVAAAVCVEVGIDASRPLLGNEVDGLSDDELARRTTETNLMAKLSPLQKARVVRVLREKRGCAVGFMGDGINDAAATRAADVGISVDTAVDVAKESADIILTKKDLLVLARGIREGRRTHTNTMKYVKLTTSSNFGNVLSMLLASVVLPFLPMTSLQLLLLGLVSDLALTALPWDGVDEGALKTPRSWDTRSVVSFMLRMGPMSTLIDAMTFALLWFVVCPMVSGGAWDALADAAQRAIFAATFQTGWLISSMWTQSAVVLMLRSEHPLEARPARALVASLAVGTLLVTLLPTVPVVGDVFGLVVLPACFYGALALLLALYLLLSNIAKHLFIRAHGELL